MATSIEQDRYIHRLAGKAINFIFTKQYDRVILFPEATEKIMDELEIIQKIKVGDTHSFALLVEKYHLPLLAFIFKILGDKDLVEDIGQDVFLTIYKSLENFDETRGVPFSAWIFTIARNRCISVLRQRGVRKPIHLDEMDLFADGRKNPEDAFLAREQMTAVAKALRQIPEPFRKTILMSLEGSSLEKIALLQNISLGTVKSRLYRAKERMRFLVSAYFGC
jgi:RNA polymerase sigma-70 factor, ECF subfamily